MSSLRQGLEKRFMFLSHQPDDQVWPEHEGLPRHGRKVLEAELQCDEQGRSEGDQ